MLKLNFIQGNQQLLPPPLKREVCTFVLHFSFNLYFQFSIFYYFNHQNCLKDKLWSQERFQNNNRMLGFGTHLCGSFPLMMSVVDLEASSVFLFQRRGVETYLLKTVKDFLTLNYKFQSEGGRLFAWMWTEICKKGDYNLPKKNIFLIFFIFFQCYCIKLLM